MNLNFYLFCLILYIFCQVDINTTEKVSYIATERPKVVYFNKKFVKNLTMVSRRYSRDDPLYYINFSLDTLVTLGNNASVDLYFYKFQGNRYIRTFVELHFKMCDFLTTTNLFGDSLKRMAADHPCPLQPGQHNFHNLTIPIQSIPEVFPYRQGRLMCNTSINHNGVNSRLFEVYIELEVKVASRNKFLETA